jgi:hypothetical protein
MAKKRRNTNSLIIVTVAAIAVIVYVSIQAYNAVGNLGEESNFSEINDITEEVELNFTNGSVALYLSNLGCSLASDCTAVQVACCDNNNVDQKSCVNLNAVSSVIKSLNANCGGTICPAFLVQADWSCSCDSGVCTTTWSSSSGNVSYAGIYK